jgi:hypothetical protein
MIERRLDLARSIDFRVKSTLNSDKNSLRTLFDRSKRNENPLHAEDKKSLIQRFPTTSLYTVHPPKGGDYAARLSGRDAQKVSH